MKHIADAIEFAVPTLSDEEWAARDTKIAADKTAAVTAERAERDRVRIEEYMSRGFPRRALETALSADTAKPAIARVAKWNLADDSVLVLSGPAGCGKTVAAAWWAWNRAPRPSFIRSSSFAAGSRYSAEERASWLYARSLVLDDLGSEYADTKGSYLVDLDELIDVFYGDRRPLLITTNCNVSEFKSRYGERIADRIRECGTFASLSAGSLRSKL